MIRISDSMKFNNFISIENNDGTCKKSILLDKPCNHIKYH